MHERECASQGLHCLSQLIDLDELQLTADALPELLLSAERMGFAGLNITFPCKQHILPLLDRLSREAEDLGSVNTVVFRDGGRVGHNTDSYGFAQALQRDLAGVAKETVPPAWRRWSRRGGSLRAALRRYQEATQTREAVGLPQMTLLAARPRLYDGIPKCPFEQ